MRIDAVDVVDELRKTAIHEAGHATVAAHFGSRPSILIIQDVVVGTGYRLFRGECRYRRLYQDEDRLVSVAGEVAEVLDAIWPADAPACVECFFYECLGLNGCDAEGAGVVDEELVSNCAAILVAKWPELLRTAAEAISEAVLDDDEVTALAVRSTVDSLLKEATLINS